MDASARQWIAGRRGLVGVASTPRELWQFERAAIAFVVVASTIQPAWTIFDPDPGIRWVSLWHSVTILLFLGARYYTIRWARADPEHPHQRQGQGLHPDWA